MCIVRPLPASQTDTTQKRNCSFCNILVSKYRTAQFTMGNTLINIEFDTGLLFGGQTIMLTRTMRQRTPKPQRFVSENKAVKLDDVTTEDAPPIFNAEWREYFDKKAPTHSFAFYHFFIHNCIIPPHWYVACCWNNSSWNTRTFLPYTVNTITADDLAMQGARSSASMVLT